MEVAWLNDSNAQLLEDFREDCEVQGLAQTTIKHYAYCLKYYYQFLKDLYQEFINYNIKYCNIKPNQIKSTYLLNRLKAHLVQLSANPLLNKIDRKKILRTSKVDDFFKLLDSI